MNPLFVFSVVSSILLVACGSSGDGNNAVTQPEIGDNNFEGLLESSSSLDMGGNGDVFVSSSSNALMSSSSVNISSANIEVSPESVVRGVMTDSRDGKTYKIVSIGSQIWMAENLNYEVKDSYCYNNSVDSCAKYGRLYTWAAAVGKSEEECGQKKCGLIGEVRGVCPKGWHLPDSSEWDELYSAMGRKPYAMQAKDVAEWINATDAYGFSVLPAGSFLYVNDSFGLDDGTWARFWSSTEGTDVSAYGWYVAVLAGGAGVSFGSKRNGHSVRCLSSLDAGENGSLFVSSSSNDLMSSSSVNNSNVIPAVSPESVVMGVMTDSRDGMTYKTVTIGSQTWMAENLRYYDGAYSYCYNNSSKCSYCFDDPGYDYDCAKYGRLYTWRAAMDACPSGWHLPSNDEWNALYSAMGNSPYVMQAKGVAKWPDATDAYGFSALPAGHYYSGGFSFVGVNVDFWSASEYNSIYANSWYLSASEARISYLDKNATDYGVSVRCVQNTI